MSIHHASAQTNQNTPESPLHHRAIALAALVQAVYLVDNIARKGMADAEDCKTCIESIFINTPAEHSPLANYGDARHLRTGLRICAGILRGDDVARAKALMTYTSGLLTLERRLSKQREILQQLAEGIQRIGKQRQYFGDSMHTNVIAAIADLYGSTISTIKPRIIVRGKSEHLGQPGNTQRVRALLMAALRAAHIWHRHGGGHLTLLFRRKALLREIKHLEHIAARNA